ncbi:MAG: DUF885 domain-containing protein [Gemmatimonadetes bacterium]|nr:DUF885 domain-containing protein [Gemmatimonadota bacterium]
MNGTIRSRLGPAAASLFLLAGTAGPAQAQAGAGNGWEDPAPALRSLISFNREQSDLRLAVGRYTADRDALGRRYDVRHSPVLRERLRELGRGWLRRLAELDFGELNREGQLDYVLLRNRIEFELAMLDEEERAVVAMAPLVPFADRIRLLQESRRDGTRAQPRASAQALADLANELETLTTRLATEGGSGNGAPSPLVANSAADWVDALRATLESWYGFFAGYDPLFTWWAAAPYESAHAALDAYAMALRETLGKTDDASIVIGQPIGEAGLRAHLRHEMIPYTANELIAIAEREFQWMERELVRASRALGFGDDWRAAQEAVKEMAVPPGDKPGVIVDLEQQSAEFIAQNAHITVPPLAREVWRIEMMSPERQLVNPFFTGGEVISVSYPTNTMSHEAKLMSMRGNNPHFNRATVHHELIPGHHLQAFMTERFNAHRALYNTPFWREGWALYWEILLWERNFPRGPEDRIGMLFWRMHRAARIIFSLSFHLERMTAREAVDFLVDRVGHERANAEAEVRRSFEGNYAPLYQVAYMIGGMQFRSLYDELVTSGKMTEGEYHDAVLQGGVMPVAMVRARLDGDIALAREYRPDWRFAAQAARQ